MKSEEVIYDSDSYDESLDELDMYSYNETFDEFDLRNFRVNYTNPIQKNSRKNESAIGFNKNWLNLIEEWLEENEIFT
jgi:hypothetical protein